MKNKLLLSIGIVLNLFLISNAAAALKDINPGSYENWGRMINRLDINRAFKIKDYSRLIIRNIETAPVRYQLDGFAEEAKAKLLEQGKGILFGKIKSNPQHLEMIESKTGNGSAKTLILKISVLEIGVRPGSVMWYPMAWVDIEGELIAPQNNEVLLKFKTTRTSSVKGVTGGSVLKDLDEEGKKLVIEAIHNSFKEIGEDLNEMLFSFI